MAGFSPSGEVVKMDRQMGLLDRLARMSGCACLSDLRTPAYRRPILDALGRISAEEYPAKEWLEAMGYLLVPSKRKNSRRLVRVKCLCQTIRV